MSQKPGANQPPYVSIIIPTYNRAEPLRRCLNSLVDQTCKGFEALVCDDGSTDHTAQVVADFGQALNLTYHWAANFGGPARPRNIGLCYARGEYIAFLDSDDWWLPQKLEEALKPLAQGADVVYHPVFQVADLGQRRSPEKTPARVLQPPVFDDLLVNGNTLVTSSVVVRKELLLAIGGMSEDRDLIASEDYDCWLRLARITDRFQRIPQPLGCNWIGGGNITNPERSLRNYRRLRELYIDDYVAGHPTAFAWWIEYVEGRAYYLSHAYGLAASRLKPLLRHRVPLYFWSRALWMLLAMRLATAKPALRR